MLIAFHKPYGVLSQFTKEGSKYRALAEFGFPENVYPIGRLDADSEGLLLLSDEARWNERILNPKEAIWKTYWAQVERIPDEAALGKLCEGILIEGKKTLPAHVLFLYPQPDITARNPPIRFRKNVPDCWIELQIYEGRNRQVRKMTAAVGHPTLRLMRRAIGGLEIGDLKAGEWKALSTEEAKRIFIRCEAP